MLKSGLYFMGRIFCQKKKKGKTWSNLTWDGALILISFLFFFICLFPISLIYLAYCRYIWYCTILKKKRVLKNNISLKVSLSWENPAKKSQTKWQLFRLKRGSLSNFKQGIFSLAVYIHFSSSVFLKNIDNDPLKQKSNHSIPTNQNLSSKCFC